MKIKIAILHFVTISLLLFTQISQSQIQFQETPVSPAPFDGVIVGSIAFADVDSDGDKDVMITGLNNSSQPITKLYTNDGNGNFSEVSGTVFEGVSSSSIAFADVDDDGDEDVMITGLNNSIQRIAKLYINDGSGNFSEVIGTPFDGVFRGSIAFADVDGDGDKDVLITGLNNSNYKIAKLYINVGSGNFSEASGTPFDTVSSSSIAFADVDGDGDKDVLITGGNNSNQLIAKLYANDGSGNFSEVSGTTFEGIFTSSIAFADVDDDGDKDVLITGGINSTQPIAKLYTNDGSGSFTEDSGTSFDGVFVGSIAFSDVDGDGDKDVLITGENNSSQRIAKLYTNDSSGNFSEVSGMPFDGVWQSSIAFADVDGDGDKDVLITGQNNNGQFIAKLYVNNTTTLSIVDNNLETQFSIYPNPSQDGRFNIKTHGLNVGNAQIKIFNMMGQEVFSHDNQFNDNNILNIDAGNLSSGIYLLKLQHSRQEFSTKLILK